MLNEILDENLERGCKTNNMKNVHRNVFITVITLLFFSTIQNAFSQEDVLGDKKNIYVYGSPIESSNASKVQVSADLFYSQFQLNDTFILNDRRSTVYTPDVLQFHEGRLDVIFYNEIIEKEDSWLIGVHLIDFSLNKEVSIEHEYSEYYRILIDAKDVFSELIAKYEADSFDDVEYTQDSTGNDTSSVAMTDANLFGTWYGEEYIDKIVILRGGKGFVIFDNGASMNISISINGRTFLAQQESKSNASFFPELPREVALVKALDGSVIEWELTIENENSLSGVKYTYGANTDSTGQTVAIEQQIPVKWYR